jgi:cell division septation protein DedD
LKDKQIQEMKDKPISEEELYDELDAMYRRVADLEGKEAVLEDPIRPQEYGWTSDEPASTHREFITPPGDEIRATLEEPLKKKRRQHKKWSYRRRVIIVTLSFPLILLVSILVINFVKGRIAFQGPPSEHVQSSTRATPSGSKEQVAGLPSVQTEEKATQEIEAKEERTEFVPQGTAKPDVPITPKKYYAIQVGAFRHLENANELIEVFKEKGLDAYWISMASRNGGILYKVLVGHFADRNEAVEFVNDKSVLSDYPGSFVLPISSSEATYLRPGM